jgi:hypothetical protein
MTDVIELGSIEELAALFEQRAKAARDRIGLHTPNMRIALLREQAASGRMRLVLCAASPS